MALSECECPRTATISSITKGLDVSFTEFLRIYQEHCAFGSQLASEHCDRALDQFIQDTENAIARSMS